MSAQHLGRKRHFWHRDYPYSLRSHCRLTGRLSPVDHVYQQRPSGAVVQYLFSNMIPDRVRSIGFLQASVSRRRRTAWRRPAGAECRASRVLVKPVGSIALLACHRTAAKADDVAVGILYIKILRTPRGRRELLQNRRQETVELRT